MMLKTVLSISMDTYIRYRYNSHNIYDNDEVKNGDLRHPTLLVLGRPLEDDGSLGGGPDHNYQYQHQAMIIIINIIIRP